MPLIDNFVHQQTDTTGTGDLTVSSINGSRDFADSFSTGGTNEFLYSVWNPDVAAEYEFGLGHLVDSTTLARDTVIDSSNSDSLVSFSSGTKEIISDLPAEYVLGDFQSNKGSSLPNYAEAGTLWLDDSSTPWVLKMHDGADNIELFTIDPSGNTATATAGGSSITFQENVSQISDGTTFSVQRMTLPAGKSFNLSAARVGDLSNTSVTGLNVELYDHTNTTSVYTTENNVLQTGSLGSIAAGNEFEVRINNSSGDYQDVQTYMKGELV